MHNILLTISYDGARYCGWQRQLNGKSVQEEIEKSLEQLFKQTIRITGASRTDAGVHAAGQRAGFFMENIRIPLEKLPYAMNASLPADIAVTKAEPAPDDLHPRFSAKRKIYEYAIYNNRIRDPLSNRAWHVRPVLDTAKMIEASEYLTGTHDFKTFCASGTETVNFVRTVHALDFDTNGPLIRFRITGDAFLYNMVRIIAGTLVYAGLGKLNPIDMPAIIKSRDRAAAGVTAPPHGLTLMEILY